MRKFKIETYLRNLKSKSESEGSTISNGRKEKNMNRKIYSTLVQSAEDLTINQLCIAPELPTLVALDANLLAAINILEFQNPHPDKPESEISSASDAVEDHIVASIFVLAKALRKNLSAYYAIVQENCDDDSQWDVSF
jgi:hypothetical protein